jgi:hypothetical protein
MFETYQHAHAHAYGRTHAHAHAHIHTHTHTHTHFVCILRTFSRGANFVESSCSWIGLFVLAAAEVEGECRGTPSSILGASSLVKEYKNKNHASGATPKR